MAEWIGHSTLDQRVVGSEPPSDHAQWLRRRVGATVGQEGCGSVVTGGCGTIEGRGGAAEVCGGAEEEGCGAAGRSRTIGKQYVVCKL